MRLGAKQEMISMSDKITKQTGNSVASMRLLADALALLQEFKVEPDEDSAGGMAFVTGRISEDWFYHVVFGIERSLKANH